jgi:hypothetical protein
MSVQIPDLATSLSLSAMSELDAINICLGAIGEPDVTIVDSTLPEAVQARKIIHRVSREVQSTGLHCNTDYQYELTPDGTTSKIAVAENVLKIDASYRDVEVVTRGGFLYDLVNQVYTFTSVLKCNIYWFLAYGDLPQVARDYISIRAARVFQGEVLGSEVVEAWTELQETQAKERLMIHEGDVGEHNIFESVSVGNAINRYTNPIRLGNRR